MADRRWRDHFGLKIVSLVLAGIMWFVVSGARNLSEEQAERTLELSGDASPDATALALEPGEWSVTGVPVRVVGAGRHRLVSPATVTVRLYGRHEDVTSAMTQVVAVVDAIELADKTATAFVRVVVPPTVRLVAVEPATVSVNTGSE
jgi:hypothetical protein